MPASLDYGEQRLVSRLGPPNPRVTPWHAQRHLGADVLQPLHQEVGGAHPGLDGAEGMLDGLAALAHGLRVLVEPPLDRFEDLFVLPARDAALLPGVQSAFMGQSGQTPVQ